jgi:2-polyprenyl-3-methyl-5-hydroxy-6-metoxy-1,4-benzoquinol methylase
MRCDLLGTTHFLTGARTTDDLYDVDHPNLVAYQKQYLAHRLEMYARIMPHLERFRKTGKLLEVGSGYGYFLGMARKENWEGEGVEISPYCCQVAHERGCTVQRGRLQDAQLVQGTFDVVVLWDVIEHFSEPLEIMLRCHGLLRSGGALVMRTPDGRALAPTLHPGRMAYRDLVYPANTAEHVFHFTPQNLIAIVSKLGFKVYEIDEENPWKERVISGSNRWVLGGRWFIMRYAHRRAWPYEFVLTATKN